MKQLKKRASDTIKEMENYDISKKFETVEAFIDKIMVSKNMIEGYHIGI